MALNLQFLQNMRSLPLLATAFGAAALLLCSACGDASGTASGQFTGVGNNPNGQNPTNGGNDGGGNNGGSDAGTGTVDAAPQQSASFDIMLDKSATDVELRSSVDIQVTVAPKNYTGTVTLDVSGLPAGVTTKFSSATLNVSGTTGQTATLTLMTKSDVAPNLTNLMVRGTAGSNVATSPLALNVKPLITIAIPTNVDAMKGTNGNPSTNAFGDFPIIITAPTNISATPVEVKFVNKDSAGHCIHASNPTQGFAHDPVNNGVCNALIQQNQFSGQQRKVNATGTYTFYLHDQGDLTRGQIKIQ